MRERGSNAARQPKKGVGGHRFGRDWSHSVVLGRDSARRSTPIWSRFADFLLEFRADSAAIGEPIATPKTIGEPIATPKTIGEPMVAIGRDLEA